MIIWIGKPLALAIHDRQLAEHGGISGVRDETLLDSALARPQQLHAYGDPPPDIADLAASLAFGVARNHPFGDGNKRTAAVICETFLVLNGARLQAEDPELYPSRACRWQPVRSRFRQLAAAAPRASGQTGARAADALRGLIQPAQLFRERIANGVSRRPCRGRLVAHPSAASARRIRHPRPRCRY